MKVKGFGSIVMLLLLIPAAGWPQAPHQVGGFVLGENISHFKDKVKMETGQAIIYQEYIHEVEIRNIEGFKSGRISYGMCKHVGRIVQIRLKYADASRAFYDQVLARFKKKFGIPDIWKGDAFHIIIAWKWSFVDEQKNRISLILQHNVKDPSQKMGNVVKLAMTNLIDDERACFKAKEAESQKKPIQTQKLDWELLIPR
jgi:hypothetical protein